MNYGNNVYSNTVSVTELNTIIKGLLDTEPFLSNVFVRGEISNFKAHSSGHLYFSLKDETGVIRAVMFRSSAVSLPFRPENGMKVIAHGRVSSYVRDGQYQLYADSMEPDGIGSLYIAFEQLKAKLSAEGLFSPDRKKPIPKIPTRIGVITSPTGAAVRDIINITGRRFPMAEIVLYPALVQGIDAAASLRGAVRYFNMTGDVDVIIIGRGGGSIEDLWAFNDEMLARDIAASRIPVISAVGHETDFTICDFVSDVRAPTPSAAAELAVPDSDELKRKINNIVTREEAVLKAQINRLKALLDRYSKARCLSSPTFMVEEKRIQLDHLSEKLEKSADGIIAKGRNSLAVISGKLSALNPMAVISKGYSALFTEDGGVINSVRQFSVGEKVNMRLADGSAKAEIIEIEENNSDGK